MLGVVSEVRQPSQLPRSHVGENLRHLIGMHGLSQGELARFIQISASGLTNIVNGRSEPALRTARQAASAFGITVDELYEDLIRCLRAAAVAFDTAPVRSLRSGESVRAASEG